MSEELAYLNQCLTGDGRLASPRQRLVQVRGFQQPKAAHVLHALGVWPVGDVYGTIALRLQRLRLTRGLEAASEYPDASRFPLFVESVDIRTDDLKAIVTNDLTAVSAIVSYAAVSAQGDQLRSMQNRLSWVLRTTGYVTRIVHEHNSAPAGFEDMKAILSR